MFILEGDRNMKRNELYGKVNNIFDQFFGIELFAVLKHGDEKILKRVNIRDEHEQENNTSNGLRDGFANVVKSLLYCEEEEEILKLSAADERKNAIYCYDLDDLPFEMELLQKVSEQSNTIELFEFGQDSLNEIVGFIVLLGDVNRHIALYKQQYPISLLNRDKYMLTPIPHRNRFEKYDREILRIDFNCQFLLLDGEIYILDIDKMEKICSFTEIIVKEAKRSIKKIQEIDILDNVDSLNDELDNLTFARKLTRVYKDSKVIGEVDNETIIEFAQSHSYFKKNRIKLNENKDKFILDSKRAKNAFLKLLNDDLLTSELTNAEYESLAKNDA